MNENVIFTLTIVGTIIAMFGSFSALMIWLMSRMETQIHADMICIREDVSGANKRIDAMGARIDAMGARIDATQAILMRMLEKQGR